MLLEGDRKYTPAPASKAGSANKPGWGEALAWGAWCGALAGTITGAVMVALLAATAGHYFTSAHRLIWIPLYLWAWSVLLFAPLGLLYAALWAWAKNRLPGGGRISAGRCATAFFVATPAGWVLLNIIAWVVYRGRLGAELFLALAAGAGAAIALGLVAARPFGSGAVRGLRHPGRKAALAGLGAVASCWFFLAAQDAADILPRPRPPQRITAGAGGMPSPYAAARRAGAAPATRRIVLITADTLRADRLGFSGYERAVTPHLDRFAGQAAVFRNAHAASSGTVPSFIALFSGMDPVFAGGRNQLSSLDQNVETLAELLKEAGFATAAVVCQRLLTPESGFARGFDRYVRISPEEDDPHRLTELALREIEQASPGARAFFWFHYFNTHDPYDPPEEFVRQAEPAVRGLFVPIYDYSTVGGVNPEAVGERYRSYAGARGFPAGLLGRLYDGEVRDMDLAVGRLIQRLERSGRLNDTAVIFTSDHGESLGEHGVYARHTVGVHGPQVRVPLVIRPSGGMVPTVVEQPVASADLAPTILRLAGLPAPAAMTGRSLLDLLPPAAEAAAAPDIVVQTAFSEGVRYYLNSGRYDYPDWALISGGYKYVYYANSVFDEIRTPWNYLNAWRELVCGHIRRDELYRLGEDHAPANNRITLEPQRARRMCERLLSSPQIEAFREGSEQPPAPAGRESLDRLRSLGYL